MSPNTIVVQYNSTTIQILAETLSRVLNISRVIERSTRFENAHSLPFFAAARRGGDRHSFV